MAGLKTFWILLSTLFLFAACVPQTKQTECRSNEAFNASLRTCVPIVGGPSSFINVDTYNPQFTQTRYKDDMTTLSFTISVSNPYNQSYSIQWERVFNAAPVSMCSNSLTCTTSANFLGTVLGQVGTHIITAKVVDGTGTTVDSHNFELKINDLPLPVINTASIVPASYAFDALPTDANIPFSFTIRNNNATISALDGYKTQWTIVKNGSTIYTENDNFTDFSTSGSNYAYLGTSPTPAFDPDGASFGVGSYIIRAVVSNTTPGQVVAEHQWNVIVKQPDLANVTNISAPAPGVTITAHNDVDYNDFPAFSWVYSSPATQPNFCVNIDDRDGTYADNTGLPYPDDGPSIQVRFYLDSLGGDICTKKTVNTPGTQTICLNDLNPCIGTGAPFDTSLLKFTNSSPTVQQIHKVTARLFDEATTYEFERSDVIPSNGSYPVEWTVLVKPKNSAPQLSFGTSPTCSSAGAFTRNCAVNQGSEYDFYFKVTDDFYSPSANPEEFDWRVNLKRNGTDLSSTGSVTECTKGLTVVNPLPLANSATYNATNGWFCKIRIPHFDGNGPLNPAVGTYSVLLTMVDSGSPVGGTPESSQSLQWNLTVTETNPDPGAGNMLAAQVANNTSSHVAKAGVALDPGNIASFASELETVTFRPQITDVERDDLRYKISSCPTPACTSGLNVITSPAFIDFMRASQVVKDNLTEIVPGYSWQIPEDFLLTIGQDVDTTTPVLAYFKVEVEDIPHAPLTSIRRDERIFSFYIRNTNPPPVIDTATASPLTGTNTTVYSGVPVTINPGSASDPSGPATEKDIKYQWFADNGGGFTAITPLADGQRILKFTPGNSTTPITLKVCVGDRPAANPVSSTGTCYGNWTITPKKYLENLTATGINQMGPELAVWYDNTNTVANTQVIYSAYTDVNVDSSVDIYVEKTVKNAAGNIVLNTQTISFPALPTGSSTTVQNLSITGNAESIYVAYVASASSSPATMIPRIRRIEKTRTGSGAKTGRDHPESFGFNYAHYPITDTSANVSAVNGNGTGGFATVTFTAPLTAGQQIVLNGVTFTAVAAAPTGAAELCSATCASASDAASQFADKINNSTNPLLDGITAVANLGDVRLYGQYASDYLDFDGTITLVPGIVALANGVGEIFISGDRWHLPIINSSLGAEQNNITVLSGRASFAAGDPVHLRDSARLALSTNDVLTEMGKASLFDAELNQAGELVIARVSGEVADAGALALFRYEWNGTDWQIFDTTGGSATDRNEMDIFGTSGFAYVKLATNNTGNNHYYVLAKENSLSGGDYMIGRYNPELDSSVAGLEYVLTNKISLSDATDDVISNAKMKFPDIVSVPGSQEARIFFHTVGTGVVPYPVVARWKTDDSVSCGTCFSLNGTLEYNSNSKVGISKAAPSITLGTAGSVGGENVNHMVFVLMNSDLLADDAFKPQLGLINIDAESIQSSSVDPTGLFIPPFVK